MAVLMDWWPVLYNHNGSADGLFSTITMGVLMDWWPVLYNHNGIADGLVASSLQSQWNQFSTIIMGVPMDWWRVLYNHNGSADGLVAERPQHKRQQHFVSNWREISQYPPESIEHLNTQNDYISWRQRHFTPLKATWFPSRSIYGSVNDSTDLAPRVVFMWPQGCGELRRESTSDTWGRFPCTTVPAV
ncbi:hypothetical protein J6590_006188 [Homalodisca vitripennis]|nr:hypothetical protein J6590_006188 [Homalodisca vitripennis]